jgi:hypothetical protein
MDSSADECISGRIRVLFLEEGRLSERQGPVHDVAGPNSGSSGSAELSAGCKEGREWRSQLAGHR